jgi:DNA-binding Lrp family transcriptional regulator
VVKDILMEEHFNQRNSLSGIQVSIDEKDRHILSEISVNSRRSLGEIGKSIGISEQVLGYRLRELIKKGVISGFYPLIRIDKLGLNIYRVFFRISKATPKREKEIIANFKINKKVLQLARTGWMWDLVVDFIEKDTYSFSQLLKESVGEFAENLSNHTMQVPANIYFFKSSYLSKERSTDQSIIYNGINSKEKLDETDYQILRTLSKNARATDHKIGKVIGLASSTVKNRIRSLEKRGVIQAYGTLMHTNLFGGIAQTVILRVNEINDAENRIFKFAKDEPNVISYFRSLERRYNLGVECNNKQEFMELMRKIKYEFADVLYDYEVVGLHHYIMTWCPFR